MIDYQKNYQQSIDPHAGGSFIGHATDQTAPTYRAPASDASAETKKRQKLLAALQQALAGLPSADALEILDKQLPQDFPDRDVFLGQFAEALDEQQTGSAADAYVQRMMAQQQPRPQPAPTQQPDRADGMTAEYAPLEPVPQEPAEETEPEQEAPQEEPNENAVQLFEQFAQFVDGLTDQQKEQLRNLLLT